MSLHGVGLQTERNSSAKFRPHLGTCLMVGRDIGI
jgi:hypothetical protein